MKVKMFCELFFSVMFFLSCQSSENPVPQFAVDFCIPLNNAQYSALQNAGGYAYVTGGVRGIFVYCLSPGEYYAYDRCCTFNITDSALVYDTKKHCLMHRDTTTNCMSQFSPLLQGAVAQGPAQYPLKKYQTELTSNGQLRIYNDIYAK